MGTLRFWNKITGMALGKLCRQPGLPAGLALLCILLPLCVAPAAARVVEQGVDDAALNTIMKLAGALLLLYLLRILFRFMSNYLTHKAAWFLVGDLRSRLYDMPAALPAEDGGGKELRQRMSAGAPGTGNQIEMGYAVFGKAFRQILLQPVVAQQGFKGHGFPPVVVNEELQMQSGIA